MNPEIPPDLQEDWQRLLDEFYGLDSVLIAFSGGADSSLLLAAAKEALGGKAHAALCAGVFTPPWEAARARETAARLGVELMEMDPEDLTDPEIAANDGQRCYYCKRRRLGLLETMAAELGIARVAEGSQVDDAKEHRPGAKAVAELGVLSPLSRAGLGKKQVRALGRALGLAAALAPSGACLATRVPTGTGLDAVRLDRIARAESAVRGLVPGQVRVRDDFPLARLELDSRELFRAAAEPLREQLIAVLKEAGYQRVVLDLEGYRTGGGADSAIVS